MQPIDVPSWVLIVGVIAPFVGITAVLWRVNRRLGTSQRALCLREIETSGGFDAWKAKHFGR